MKHAEEARASAAVMYNDVYEALIHLKLQREQPQQVCGARVVGVVCR